ncbi:MAG: hypothetical protein HN390_00785 [Anaerolineae bacterium]|nr:hypothetical protein [Anaerolineae bacterium]MBT7192224.1 hypothetical protein [Anaerolineae bacterium]MBT7989629.1 hypothetical protein [Anaerolineae bacterium]
MDKDNILIILLASLAKLAEKKKRLALKISINKIILMMPARCLWVSFSKFGGEKNFLSSTFICTCFLISQQVE